MTYINFRGLIICFGLILWTPVIATSQTVFATETFGTGAAKGTSANGFAGDMGNWTVVNTGTNGGSANNWYVSGEECGNAAGVCGSACPGGDNSLHVSAIGGLCGTPDCGAAYDETSAANATNKRAISPTIDCTGNYSIELNFNYIAAQGDDGFFVEYSTNNGSTWTTFTGGNVATSQCCSCLDAFLCSFIGFCCPPQVAEPCGGGQGLWTAVNLSFPVAADNNPNVRFAFNWSNDGNGIGTDPSVAIDDITLTYDVILPIELSNFEGKVTDNLNELSWITQSENNASHFSVEYSVDGIHYTEIGRVESARESQKRQFYSFIHETTARINYYRIKSVSMNGDYQLSETISLQNDLSQIYLSRSSGEFIIHGLDGLNGVIYIYDLYGRQTGPEIKFTNDKSEQLIRTGDLKSGVYIIRVSTSDRQKQFKIVLQ